MANNFEGKFNTQKLSEDEILDSFETDKEQGAVATLEKPDFRSQQTERIELMDEEIAQFQKEQASKLHLARSNLESALINEGQADVQVEPPHGLSETPEVGQGIPESSSYSLDLGDSSELEGGFLGSSQEQPADGSSERGPSEVFTLNLESSVDAPILSGVTVDVAPPKSEKQKAESEKQKAEREKQEADDWEEMQEFLKMSALADINTIKFEFTQAIDKKLAAQEEYKKAIDLSIPRLTAGERQVFEQKIASLEQDIAQMRQEQIEMENEVIAEQAETLGLASLAEKLQQDPHRYVPLRILGEGGMGRVIEAVSPQGKKVVIKVMLAPDADSLARFEKEAIAQASLKDHHIAKVSSADFSDPESAFFVMDKAEGEDLEGKKLSSEDLIEVGLQILPALEEAHSKGLVHRDIKPANIFSHVEQLAPVGGREGSEITTYKIGDFGMAFGLGELGDSSEGANGEQIDIRGESHPLDRLSVTGSIIGTPSYMAPEQFVEHEPDASTDIYQLGATWYKLLSGKESVQAGTLQELVAVKVSDNYGHLTDTLGVNSDLALLIDDMMGSDPKLRPTASEVGEELERIKAGGKRSARLKKRYETEKIRLKEIRKSKRGKKPGLFSRFFGGGK